MAEGRDHVLPGSVGRETSKAIFDDALIAYNDERHPRPTSQGFDPDWWTQSIAFTAAHGRRRGG